jgi:hypothetical protein
MRGADGGGKKIAMMMEKPTKAVTLRFCALYPSHFIL